MREALMLQLEKLSYYQHLSLSGGRERPIFAYRIVDIRGARFHVLSRIQDAGLDFTGRTNFIAHHLVLAPEELRQFPTPPVILRDWSEWGKSWTKEPQLLESERLDRPCRANWQKRACQRKHGSGLPATPRTVMVCWNRARGQLSELTINQMKQSWDSSQKVWNFWKFETYAGTFTLPHGTSHLQPRCKSRTIQRTFAGVAFILTILPQTGLPGRIAARFLLCAPRSGLKRKRPWPEPAGRLRDSSPNLKMLESLKVSLLASRRKRKAFPSQYTSGFQLIAPITDRSWRARRTQNLWFQILHSASRAT